MLWGSCEQQGANGSCTKPIGFANCCSLYSNLPNVLCMGLGAKGVLLVLGGYLNIFNNRQFQFVSIRERRVIVEWLVLGSWKYIRIKEPLGSSYFQNRKDPPPCPAVFRKEPAILRQLIDHLQSFWGGGKPWLCISIGYLFLLENRGYEPPWYPVMDWCGF